MRMEMVGPVQSDCCDDEGKATVSEACMSLFTVQRHIFISLPGTKFPNVHLL